MLLLVYHIDLTLETLGVVMSIHILVLRPGQEPASETITGTLESMQAVVGGPLQGIPLTMDLDLYCHDEGKLQALSPNRLLRDDDGIVYDVVVGTAFVAAADRSGDLIDLTSAQIETYRNVFSLRNSAANLG